MRRYDVIAFVVQDWLVVLCLALLATLLLLNVVIYTVKARGALRVDREMRKPR